MVFYEDLTSKMAYLCPGVMWFAGAEEAVNTLVSDNCEKGQEVKTVIHQINIAISCTKN